MAKYDLEMYAKKSREAVSEGIVMLKNDNNTLPLQDNDKIALFGRNQFSYYKSGTGSGGLVNTSYVVSIKDALVNYGKYRINEELENLYKEWLKDHPFDKGSGWAMEPWYQEEMPIDRNIVDKVKKDSDIAIVFIGRTAGEDQDNKAEAGSYLLTNAEKQMLKHVCKAFEKTIVLLNVGNIIDMKWVEEYKPAAVLYVWQGGQEGGNGVLDVLNGTVNPSGKLADTIAYDIKDYPSTINYGSVTKNYYKEDIYVGYRYFEGYAKEKVLYPFGFGLSYTTFEIPDASLERGEKGITVKCSVINTGAVEGKEVVQLYCTQPQTKLNKAAKVLCGFDKTRILKPGESQEISIYVPYEYISSYDDMGVTGHRNCWLIEQGDYLFEIGNSVRNTISAGIYRNLEDTVIEQLEEAMAPTDKFERLTFLPNGEKAMQDVPTRTIEPSQRRLDNLPEEIAYTGDKGIKLRDVAEGKAAMKDFIAQLSDEDLMCIVRGEGMNSPRVTPGTGGAFGGVSDSLVEFGIPTVCVSDGPSGIRMDCGNIAFSLPNGACLASSFNMELVTQLYEYEGLELRKDHIDALLGPGINIHRNPLNGRNFEYFSEDPFLTGKMAVAQLEGMHKAGTTGVIKHFACNNQEEKRHDVESVVSQRALREIYLRAFEIAVKEGKASMIMSSYNPVNGFWTASNYDLLTTILRKQWGYTGIVMSDWWAKGNDEHGEGTRENAASMVRAQNDLYMCSKNPSANSNNDNHAKALKEGAITRQEYQRSAVNICNSVISTPTFSRFIGVNTELDEELACIKSESEALVLEPIEVVLNKEAVIEGDKFDTEKGSNLLFRLKASQVGHFTCEFICRASDESSEVAQIPCTIFNGATVLTNVDLIGNEKDWKSYTFDVENSDFEPNIYLRCYFGQSGMVVKELKIRLNK
ncbi:MAG: glycoside hydrolase family 3 C-terminal domain-containing protein [Butyrivibrio sp.]|nr:glycoside hydrolase family 3 C-terminal domain-containing protein [Butyrivibrio sp.]